MNKTDLIFYLSTAGGLAALFAKLATGLVSNSTLLWIGIIATMLNFLAFEFYEKINGTNTPPIPPT